MTTKLNLADTKLNIKSTVDIEQFEEAFTNTHENLPIGWNDTFTLPTNEEVYCFSVVREALYMWNSK